MRKRGKSQPSERMRLTSDAVALEEEKRLALNVSAQTNRTRSISYAMFGMSRAGWH